MLYNECFQLASYARLLERKWPDAFVSQWWDNHLSPQQRKYLREKGVVSSKWTVVGSITLDEEGSRTFSKVLVLDLARIGVVRLTVEEVVCVSA